MLLWFLVPHCAMFLPITSHVSLSLPFSCACSSCFLLDFSLGAQARHDRLRVHHVWRHSFKGIVLKTYPNLSPTTEHSALCFFFRPLCSSQPFFSPFRSRIPSHCVRCGSQDSSGLMVALLRTTPRFVHDSIALLSFLLYHWRH